MERHDLRSDDGSILVVAIVLMAIMLSVALSSFAFVDGQQQRATEQRQRESALNLAEGVLYAQGFALARNWPGNLADGTAMPTTCRSSASPVLIPCPDPRTLAAANSSSPASANFANADASQDVTWTTRIRDNGGAIADAFDVTQMDTTQTTGSLTCPGPCKWDANGDLKLWVQAQAVVHGRPRNLVALLKREEFAEAFPNNTITAGSFQITNSGNKTVIDGRGSQVTVRCVAGLTCALFDALKNQVVPATVIRDPATPRALSAEQVARFKAKAQTANPPTYYTTCQPGLQGKIIFIDLPDAEKNTTCTDSSSATYNSATDPGFFIMPRGNFKLGGTMYGLMYMGNEQNSSGSVLTLNANSFVIGGVAVDGPGGLVVGQASGPRPTITYLANAFTAPVTFGTAGLVQNTWRELTPIADPG
jgi:type II secretory pathway pseudopilin PulG